MCFEGRQYCGLTLVSPTLHTSTVHEYFMAEWMYLHPTIYRLFRLAKLWLVDFIKCLVEALLHPSYGSH